MQSGVYLFSSWFILIVASFALSRKLQPDEDKAPSEPPGDDKDPATDGTH